MELRLGQQQRDADVQVARVIELEGMLNDSKVDAQRICKLQERNDVLEMVRFIAPPSITVAISID